MTSAAAERENRALEAACESLVGKFLTNLQKNHKIKKISSSISSPISLNLFRAEKYFPSRSSFRCSHCYLGPNCKARNRPSPQLALFLRQLRSYFRTGESFSICSITENIWIFFQMNSLLKNIKSERTPLLKKYISLPILLSPERDEELAKLTEQVKFKTMKYFL